MPVCEALCDSEVVKKAYELNSPVFARYGENGYSKEMSYLSVSKDNIIADTVKLAEDGSGDLIVRLYECMNTKTRTVIKLGFDAKGVFETNMLEENKKEIKPCQNKSEAELDFNGFEVKTLRIKRN